MVPVTANNAVSYPVIIGVENHDGVLMPGLTCVVNFIVEKSENVLLVSNAALRYQPSTLSAEQIDEMVFVAGLANMDDDQRKAAIEEREQAMGTTRNQGQSANITKLFAASPAPKPPPPQHAGEGSRAAAVMRNIWYFNSEGKFEVIRVQTGINNGLLTEILSIEDLEGEDLEGKQVILREKLF
jgi:HlyD family secretion protein